MALRPHTEKLESPYKTLSNTLAVKGLMDELLGPCLLGKCALKSTRPRLLDGSFFEPRVVYILY